MFKYWHDLLDKIALLFIDGKQSPIATLNPMAHRRLLLITSVVLLVLTVSIYAFGVNKSLFLWLQSWGRYVPASIWASITLFGDALTVSVMLLLFARKYPHIVWAGVMGALLTTVIVQSLKHSLVLPRPPLILSPEEFTLIGPEYQQASFPSGHSTAIWVLASVWLFGAYRRVKAVLLMSIAAMVSLSRVMVGAHWPVDIAAGALLGWLGGWSGTWMACRWRWGITVKGQRIIVAALLLAALFLVGYDSGYTQAGILVNIIAGICLMFGGIHFYGLLRYPERLDHPGADGNHSQKSGGA